MAKQLDMTLLRLLRDTEEECSAAETAWVKTARGIVRLLTDLDEFDMRAFEALCEDVRAQKPALDKQRADIAKLRAQIAAS